MHNLSCHQISLFAFVADSGSRIEAGIDPKKAVGYKGEFSVVYSCVRRKSFAMRYRQVPTWFSRSRIVSGMVERMRLLK